jgi:hypothetical protein
VGYLEECLFVCICLCASDCVFVVRKKGRLGKEDEGSVIYRFAERVSFGRIAGCYIVQKE